MRRRRFADHRSPGHTPWDNLLVRGVRVDVMFYGVRRRVYGVVVPLRPHRPCSRLRWYGWRWGGGLMFVKGGRCVGCLLLVDLVSCVVLTLIRDMYLNLCPLSN